MCRKLIHPTMIVSILILSLNLSKAAEVAHWALNNDATDSVGGIDGTIMNGAVFTTDAVLGSHALELDSSQSQYIDFGNPPELPDGRSARSMCGWGKTDTVAGGWRWIAAYGSPATSQAMFIGINGTALYGGGYADDVYLNNFWEVGVWHHICLTYDGTTARLYADGVEVASAAKNWDLVQSRAHIGRQVNDIAEFWDGAIDDVHIYDHALSETEIRRLAAVPKATRPEPADGSTHPNTWVSLSWTEGAYAISYDVYFGENFDEVNSGAEVVFRGKQVETYFVAGFPGFAYPDGLVPGTTYYWRIDGVDETNPDSPWIGDVWSFTVPSKKAYGPIPADGSKFVDPTTKLTWTAGFGAKLHTVYFGESLEDVNNASGGSQQGTTTYTVGPLELGKSYYWRVDEFDAATTYKGDVWSFRTQPAIPISDPNLVAWWKMDEGSGDTALDWSGYGNHGELRGGPQWVSGYDGGALEFDGGDDYVNFSSPSGFSTGTADRSMCGWGKTDSVASGWRWIAAYGSAGTSLAMFIGMNGDDLYGGGYGDDVLQADFWEIDVWHHICLTYDGTTARLYADGILVATEAKDWNLTLSRAHIGRQVNDAAEFWDGAIDDVRIYDKVLTQDEILEAMRGDTTLAWKPDPANESLPNLRYVESLNWSAGETASEHDVYFGTDEEAVENSDVSDTMGVYRGRQSSTSYTIDESLEWGGGPYYWRIDEVTNDGIIIKGRVWEFSIADYITIDDFENYNDLNVDEPGSNRIYLTWVDGFDNPTSNGSIVGYANPPFAERTVVHSGSQSMPYAYDNTVGKSEATLTLTDTRDWTQNGVGRLVIWYIGNSANDPETMYVILDGTAGVDNPDANAAQAQEWTEWAIDLLTFADQGINLGNINTITLGFGNRTNPVVGGTGMVFFDDIRLYRPIP
jgi:hypothetical protein